MVSQSVSQSTSLVGGFTCRSRRRPVGASCRVSALRPTQSSDVDLQRRRGSCFNQIWHVRLYKSPICRWLNWGATQTPSLRRRSQFVYAVTCGETTNSSMYRLGSTPLLYVSSLAVSTIFTALLDFYPSRASFLICTFDLTRTNTDDNTYGVGIQCLCSFVTFVFLFICFLYSPLRRSWKPNEVELQLSGDVVA